VRSRRSGFEPSLLTPRSSLLIFDMRVACLYVGDFALAVCYRGEPELRGCSVVVTDGAGARAPVVACSPEAAAHGVHRGMSATQARAACEGVVFRSPSADALRAAQNALCDVACSLSPRVQDGGPGLVFLEIGGMGALYESEAELVRNLARRAVAVGFDAAVGVASTVVAARLAARGGSGRAVIPRGEEWAFLAPLPVSMLEPEPSLAESLVRWGIRTLGDLAALPAGAVATRLGAAGALLVRRARGEDEAPFVTRPPARDFVETIDLDYGLESIDPFLFVVRPLLERLLARLELHGLVCGDLRLSLRLADRGRDERTVAVAAPSREIKPLLALLRLHLESHPPPAPVVAIAVAATAEQLRPVQLDLLRPNGPAPARLAVTLAKLAALCGDAGRVGMPVVADSHCPHAYGVKQFAIAEPETGSREPGTAARGGPGSRFPVPGLALRAVRPPRELEIFEDRGRLDFVRPAANDNGFRCQGRVVTSAGPWRVHGEWWKDDPCRRDYYDVQLSDGGVYRFYYDAARSKWFVDGYYD
jgi:protein ImuB